MGYRHRTRASVSGVAGNSQTDFRGKPGLGLISDRKDKLIEAQIGRVVAACKSACQCRYLAISYIINPAMHDARVA